MHFQLLRLVADKEIRTSINTTTFKTTAFKGSPVSSPTKDILQVPARYIQGKLIAHKIGILGDSCRPSSSKLTLRIRLSRRRPNKEIALYMEPFQAHRDNI